MFSPQVAAGWLDRPTEIFRVYKQTFVKGPSGFDPLSLITIP